MPPDAVYVGRPTRWGNPYSVEEWGRDEAIRKFRLLSIPNLDELRGKDLACWCPLDKTCHADVLLELANH